MPLRSLGKSPVVVCSLVAGNIAVPGNFAVELRSLDTVTLPLISTVTITVTGLATEDVENSEHGNSAVAIPGRVTGDVAIPGHRTGNGVYLGHATGAVAVPGYFIGTGKFPRQFSHAAAFPVIGTLTPAVTGTLPVPLRSVGTIHLLFVETGTESVSVGSLASLPGSLRPLCNLP